MSDRRRNNDIFPDRPEIEQDLFTMHGIRVEREEPSRMSTREVLDDMHSFYKKHKDDVFNEGMSKMKRRMREVNHKDITVDMELYWKMRGEKDE